MTKELIFSLILILASFLGYARIDNDKKFELNSPPRFEFLKKILKENYDVFTEEIEVLDYYYDNEENALLENQLSLRLRRQRKSNQLHFKFLLSKNIIENQIPVSDAIRSTYPTIMAPRKERDEIEYQLLGFGIDPKSLYLKFGLKTLRSRLYLSLRGERIYTISWDQVFHKDLFLFQELEVELSEKILQGRERWNEETKRIKRLIKKQPEIGPEIFISKYKRASGLISNQKRNFHNSWMVFLALMTLIASFFFCRRKLIVDFNS